MRRELRIAGRLIGSPRRELLIETAAWLVLARVALSTLRFCDVERFLSRQARTTPVPSPDGDRLCHDTRSAIELVARYLPGPFTCFHRGIAAHAVLRRRGVATTLYYGARHDDGQLAAHVWVRYGELDVIGVPYSDYAIVATFPRVV